jgi:hypothetical protein
MNQNKTLQAEMAMAVSSLLTSDLVFKTLLPKMIGLGLKQNKLAIPELPPFLLGARRT